MLSSVVFSLAVLSGVVATACAEPTTTGNFTQFNSPIVKPFLQLTYWTTFPVNVSTIYGVTGSFPNLEGNFTGAIEGTVLPIGAALEIIPPATNGTVSFLTNTLTLNTTDGTTILLESQAVIHYANRWLHGFSPVSFSTDDPKYMDLAYGSFIAELESGFSTGKAVVDIFKLETGGKRDGSPIPALEPPTPS